MFSRRINFFINAPSSFTRIIFIFATINILIFLLFSLLFRLLSLLSFNANVFLFPSLNFLDFMTNFIFYFAMLWVLVIIGKANIFFLSLFHIKKFSDFIVCRSKILTKYLVSYWDLCWQYPILVYHWDIYNTNLNIFFCLMFIS